MAFPFQQAAFTVGEVGPALFGRQDLARTHVGASTMRNMFVRYTGGSSSRAGTSFVGFSKQTGRSYPPRLIPFQFNINQGLVLEFGNFYMRVIQNGSFVTEAPLVVTNITNASPAVVTTSGAVGGSSATPNTGAVVSSYAPGELVTLAGGTFLTPAVISVTNTRLLSTLVGSAGSGYVPADTIVPSGGTQTTPAQLTVATTKVSALPTIAAAGAGGADGTQTVTGTTGTGTLFQASVTVTAGAITAVLSLTVAGSYTVNPTVLANEPVTGAGLVGAALSITMGVNTVSVSAAGVFTANPAGLTFTQGSTSGAGAGATFQFALMAPNAVTFSTPGVYTAFPTNPVAQASTNLSGLGATFTVTTMAVSPFVNGDWILLSGVNGMSEVNGQIYIAGNVTPTTFQIFDVYGNPINSTAFDAYISGGTAARIYTASTPYAEADLSYLKFTQSKDVMSLCLVNQATGVEYVPYDLSRLSNNNWVFEVLDGENTIGPPTNLSGVATASGSVFYQYVVTSVNPDDGSESVASAIIDVPNAVNISATAGTITLSWTGVVDVNQYNIYKASPGYGAEIPVGSLFGFAGMAYGTSFTDSNIVPDLGQVPPRHDDPFARGRVIGATVVSGGAGYNNSCVVTVNTATGSGANLLAVTTNGVLRGIIVDNAGEGYLPADTITITGDGAGATATLNVGALTGTYPSTVSYLQQRRAYANTLNQPDTYFLSIPGSFTNFDKRIPTIDSDAITGNPWATQVNGIQWIVSMPGGGLVFTGADVWQLTGNGGSSLTPQLITPSTQQAQPQAYNGASATVPPQKIEDSIIYCQNKGSIWRSLTYNYLNNIYSGIDITLNSPQLFTGFTSLERAWCEEPFKVMWAVRNDGVLLSLTFVKAQEVAGWARHDTQGLWVSCCSITELPVDALYLAAQRTIGSNSAYTIERMNNRLWNTVEDAWCVDAGLSLSQPTPAATLVASSSTGLGAISGATGIVGGTGYSTATVATVVDDNGQGPGTGATVSLAIVGGVVTGVTIDTAGSGYVRPALVISDPENSGSGASATLTLNNAATFTASAAVFAANSVGRVIRMGGGVAVVTQFNSTTNVTANIISPIIKLIPNTTRPLAATSGNWSMTQPVSTITGLQYLAGMVVTGTYDGKKIPPTLVPPSGEIPLPAPATQVTAGLGFVAQLQTLYTDPPGLTQQARRKKNSAVTVRVEASGSFLMGANQPDGSVQSPIQIAPTWQNLTAAPTKAVAPYNSTTVPLWTGDIRVPLSGGFDVKGQAAFEQSDPFPLNILSCVSEILPGDMPEEEPERRRNSSGRMPNASA